MPSSQLAFLCEQIENQKTDSFAKFYMYLSLLNCVSKADKKSFTDGLPRYARFMGLGVELGLGGHADLNIGGNMSPEFTNVLEKYKRQFKNEAPYWTHAVQNIVFGYVRRGNITDLMHIMEQMLTHLNSIHGKQQYNEKICSSIGFLNKKTQISEFIGEIAELNRTILKASDSVVNISLSATAVVAGLIFVLGSVFTLIPTVIGLGLIGAGGYGIYSYASQLDNQLNNLMSFEQSLLAKLNQFPRNENLLSNANYKSFFASIIKPLPHAAITAIQQVSMDEKSQKDLSELHGQIDATYLQLGI